MRALLLLCGCAPEGRSVTSPEPDALVSFAVWHDETQVFDVARVPPEALSVRPGRTLSLVTLRREDLLGAHEAIDASRLEAVDAIRTMAGEACDERISVPGDEAEVLLPKSTPVWRWASGENSEWRPTALPSIVLASLRLRVPLAGCPVPLRARDFALEGQVLASPFHLHGSPRSIDSGTDTDIKVFAVHDVAYLDPDTALVVMHHGLLRVRRGTRIESEEVPEYFASQLLEDSDWSRPWHLRSVAVRPGDGTRPLRVALTGWRKRPDEDTESIVAVLALEGERFTVRSSTVTIGGVGRAELDATGRFFAAMSEHKSALDASARNKVVFAHPDRDDGAFETILHRDEVQQVVATTRVQHPHAILSHGATRLWVGDLRQTGRVLVDDPVRSEGQSLTGGALGLVVYETERQLVAVTTSVRAELTVWRETKGWETPRRHFDLRTRAAQCSSDLDACGEAGAPPRLNHLWSFAASDGAWWTMASADICPYAVGMREDGCTGVVELSSVQGALGRDAVRTLRPAPSGQTALVGGERGLLVELVP